MDGQAPSAGGRRSTAKYVLALLAVLAVIVGAIGIWASAKKAKQTASAVATVAGTRIAAKRGTDDTIVTLTFQAGSTAAHGRARVSGVHPEDYPVGRAVRICYDPADVGNLRMDDGPCT